MAYRLPERFPPAETLRTTPALPEVLPTTVNELNVLKNSLANDVNTINSHHSDARRYYWLGRYEQYEPVLREASRDLQKVNSALSVAKKIASTAKSESLAVRDAIPPSLETLLATLNGTIVINPLFNDIASEQGLDTSGYLKDDKIKTLVKFYHKKTDLLKDALTLKINTLNKSQLDSTLKMLASDKIRLLPSSEVKSLKTNDSKKEKILEVIDKEILLDASKRGSKTADGSKRIKLPPRATDLIQEFVGTKKAGIKKRRKKSTYKKKK
jgi:hypothetical protein